ncbi:MAG: filamentous hemagglutinin N-terminal domain-containing protein [Coleofasciculus sp. D1-CHI-01]|uniref:two-partner secretion domain-containing protein n=1 Tax=Coleofasciculus sp. D1-CHI-01 TaxID=3068482 RepID=UPI0032FBDA7D
MTSKSAAAIIRQSWCWWLIGGFGMLSAIASFPDPTLAQITPDDTLGVEGSIVTPFGQIDIIQGGAIRGINLFHSFGEFNIDVDRGAYFFSPANIQNILTRVTDKNPSYILGTLGTFGDSTPNLFLINPNGIIFGSNAKLDVGGSFVATTANGIGWNNQGQFSASQPETSQLLTINPNVLFFNKLSNSAEIVNRSTSTIPVLGGFINGELLEPGLQVLDGKSLLLIGGDVRIEAGGRLDVFGGRIELGGLAESGEVRLQVDHDTLSLNFAPDSLLSDVSLADNALVIVQGTGGGNIIVNANTFKVTNGGQLVAGTSGKDNAGNIIINANASVDLNGSGSGVSNSVFEESSGQGGNIEINTNSFSATSGAFVLAVTRTNASGNSGDVFIKSDAFTASSGVVIGSLSLGLGDAGDVRISANELVQITDTEINATTDHASTGDAGNIVISAKTIRFADNSDILANANGIGNGGNVTVQASETISFSDNSDIFTSSGIFAEAEGVGNGGTVIVQADGNVSFSRESDILTATRLGNGGDVIVKAEGQVNFLENSSINTGPLVQGDGGNITITAQSLSLENDSSFNTISFNIIDSGSPILQGRDSGNITVKTTDSVILDNGSSLSTSSGLAIDNSDTGKSGNIWVETNRLIVRNGSLIQAEIFGDQPAGDLTINAAESVEVSGAILKSEKVDGETVYFFNPSQIITTTLGAGEAGNLTINTDQLMIRDGGRVDASTVGEGQGGILDVNASDSVEVSGSIPAGTTLDGIQYSWLGTFSAGTGIAGQTRINTGRLIVRDGGKILASTLGEGQGGILDINASESVEVIGTIPGTKFTEILPSQISTETRGTGTAGTITIDTGKLIVRDGAEVSVRTTGEGQGGLLDINAYETVEVRGTAIDNPQLTSKITSETSGEQDAGNLSIQTRQLIVSDRAQITASSRQGSGKAGDIEIEANSIQLNQQGELITQSESGDGGNIRLQVDNLLLLRRNSTISTTAGQAGAGGDGGNITIDAGFVTGIPTENSDITANAFEGRGGRIDITTQRIFGLEFRENMTSLSDITASSQFGIDGDYNLELLNPIDPNQGLIQLPTGLVDAEKLIDRSCHAGGAALASSFTITGRGGIPASPLDFLSDDVMVSNWVTLDGETDVQPKPEPVTSTPVQPKPIIEAQGWVKMPDGTIILTAQSPTATLSTMPEVNSCGKL